jgi:hypothetical protein
VSAFIHIFNFFIQYSGIPHFASQKLYVFIILSMASFEMTIPILGNKISWVLKGNLCNMVNDPRDSSFRFPYSLLISRFTVATFGMTLSGWDTGRKKRRFDLVVKNINLSRTNRRFFLPPSQKNSVIPNESPKLKYANFWLLGG